MYHESEERVERIVSTCRDWVGELSPPQRALQIASMAQRLRIFLPYAEGSGIVWLP